MSEEQNIRALISLAKRAEADEAVGTDPFVESVGEYIRALEEWRVKLAPEGQTPLDESSRQALVELNEIHQRVLTQANEMKQGLVGEMGEAKKKASAIRAYVDRFPQRITIAGKRKG